MSKKKSSNKSDKSSRYDMGIWTDEDETSLSQIHNLLKKYGNVFKIDMKGHGKDVWVSDKKGIVIDENFHKLMKGREHYELKKLLNRAPEPPIGKNNDKSKSKKKGGNKKNNIKRSKTIKRR